MNTKLLLLIALCFALTACGRRNPNNQPTVPAPTTVIEQPGTAPVIVPTHTSQPATQPPQPTLAPTLGPTEAPSPTIAATVAPQADPLGDELDAMLGQLEATNSASDKEMNTLDVP